ncbi:MAG: 1-acyl-sn-glycerol-3-phosphate acyltransferase [Actinomycetota bacterium]|nr:1-acyl-sn-glycerol-3-phosphate acyltransferase [Actinomycetota bacterium]
MRDLTYPPVILTAKTAFRVLGLRFQMQGTEHIPRSGGALLALNHVSYVDFVLGGFAAQPAKRLVRFMAKRELFDHRYAGPLMRSLHHISVDRADGIDSYTEAIRRLRMGEVVGIFPEATISRSFEIKELKTGAVRMAAAADVAVIPVILWGTQRMLTKDHPRDFSRGKTIGISVGAPLRPTGEDPVAETSRLRSAMASQLDAAIKAYPAEEQPPGSWWLPASYGGSAPTPKRAKELDALELRQRAKRRSQRSARTSAQKSVRKAGRPSDRKSRPD